MRSGSQPGKVMLYFSVKDMIKGEYTLYRTDVKAVRSARAVLEEL